MASRILALDLETTGRNPESDRIVEFAFIELDERLKELGRWRELINPGVQIPSEATAFHGIRDQDVLESRPFSHFAPRIQKLLSDSILLAHNHQFDLPFLHYELVRSGQPGLRVDHPAIDTVTIERFVNSHKLGPTLGRYTGKVVDGWHGAMEDAAATVEVLRAQLQEHGEKLQSVPTNLTHKVIDMRIQDEIVRPSVRHPELLPSGGFEWIDWGRKFYRGQDGVVKLAFGKHKDQPAAEHLDYVEWMLNAEFAEDTRQAARALIESSRSPRS